MSPNHTRSNPTGKTRGGPIAFCLDPPAVGGFSILRLDGESSGPRHAAVKWINAVEAGDFRAAARLARELRSRWRIGIAPLAPKGGRA